jgi:hypothetical protein
MINTLRITGVIAVLLAGALFVFPVVFGVRSDQRLNEFLGSPSAREKFEKAADSKAQPNEDRASPLVQQAEAFALYLNPPKSTPASGLKPDKTAGLLPVPTTVSPKFKVFVTSYCQDDPDLSLALIDEPGRGRHWVRKSSSVGHLVVDQVKDGVVVIRNDGQTYEVPVEKNPAPTAAATPTSGLAVPTSREIAMRSRTVPSAAATTPPPAAPSIAMSIPGQTASPEKDAKLQELARQLIEVQRNSGAGSTGAGLSDADKTARAQELITKYRAAQRSVRVSPAEAKELGDLGKDSQQAQGEPNAPAAAADDGKIEANPPDPNTSAGTGSARR